MRQTSEGTMGSSARCPTFAFPSKLRTLASTLRFLADSEIDFIAESGLTSGVFGTLIAANLFGKDEDERNFGLTQRDISHIIPAEITAAAVYKASNGPQAT